VLNLAIVIAAAGAGRRFGGDKMSAKIAGVSVLERSVDRLRRALPSSPIIVVVPACDVERWRSLINHVELVAGGERRQDSVRLGVERAAEQGAEIVVIHDGARPAVDVDDVRAVVRAIDGVDGAILCGPVPDTVKRVSIESVVLETIDRDRLRLAQTPQVLGVAALEAAWAACGPDREWSDEASMLEAQGYEVRAVEARQPNPKITTPADLDLARILLDGR
jgi:2-C-methyl-D-erythritol 4-phosphate cytidylyltransferase